MLRETIAGVKPLSGDRTYLFALMFIGSLVASSLGCGAVNEGSPVDAAPGPSIDAPLDAAVATPRCDPTKPFGAPTPVPNINSTSRDQGAVLVDDLTLYFGSDRGGAATGTDLYVATRSSPTSPFANPVPLALNKAISESGPTLTGDGRTMFYIATSAGGTGEIYVTMRADKTSAFPVGTPVTQLNSSLDDLDPFVTADGTALYFDSARDGTALHLYVAFRQGNAPFGTPQPLMTLHTSAIDGHPVVSQDGLRIYWSSTRPDGGAQGGNKTDIWTATRSSTAGAFDMATRVPELSSTSNESPSWLAPDGCTIYLQSDRSGTLGAQDIFVAVKPM